MASPAPVPGPDYEKVFLEALTRVRAQPPEEPTIVEETVEKNQDKGTTKVPDIGVVTAQNLWRHPDSHPMVLDLLLLRQYGSEWLEWDPQTFELLLPQASSLNLSKVQACKTLHLVESFWERWEVFTVCTMALNGEFPDFEVMQVPTVAQCLVSIDIGRRIRNDVSWSDEMKAFLAAVHIHDGVLVPIPPLDFVHVDSNGAAVDLGAVRSRWPTVRAANRGPLGETAEDEQLRRLLVVHGFLEESRARLRNQLPLIPHVPTS